MGAALKVIIVIVLGFGIYSIWKYGFSSESTPVTGSALLTVTDKDWVKGPADAPATLIEYTDFQCPACGVYYPLLDQLSKEMGDKLRFVVRHYPLIQIHKNALLGAQAAEAAGRQGKFWEMYDVLFVNQKEWSEAVDPMKSILPAYAGRIGLDVEKFKTDMTDSALDEKITADRGTGNDLKITGTPTFFLNGQLLPNPTSIEAFKSAVEKVIAQ
ncbi:MAG: DsbA family protein [Candidatus Moranbacteria bacterium]|jgi:protein-disulfide isomerase|nr:DsbA family protein [Candidatus Moranbacteria bacterium]